MLAVAGLATALLPQSAARADPLPDCVDGGFGPPADMVAPAGRAACVLRGAEGWSYQASWSQGTKQYLWDLAIRVVDPNGSVRQTLSERIGGISRPYGFKLWDLDRDGRLELVAHVDNGAQNGTWAVWRRPAPEASFQRAGEFGAVATLLEDRGFFLALWHMSAFESTRKLYRFDENNAIADVADGFFGRSRADQADQADREPKCELERAGGLAAAGLTREQAQERLCRER